MNHKSIAEIFNEFAGKEVQVVETSHNLVIGGKNYPMTDVKAADNEPTLKAMQEAAKEKGLRLRIWFPGSMGTMDYDTSRVNIHIVKGRDNKYRVSRGFNVG